MPATTVSETMYALQGKTLMGRVTLGELKLQISGKVYSKRLTEYFTGRKVLGAKYTEEELIEFDVTVCHEGGSSFRLSRKGRDIALTGIVKAFDMNEVRNNLANHRTSPNSVAVSVLQKLAEQDPEAELLDTLSNILAEHVLAAGHAVKQKPPHSLASWLRGLRHTS